MSEMNYKTMRKHKKSHGGHRGHFKSGGHVHEDEAEDKKLIKKMVGKAKIKMKSGGDVEGKHAHKRADKKEHRHKYAAGGHTKHKGGKDGHTKVNVIVAGAGGQPGGAAPPMMPPRPPMAPPPQAMPPKPPMAPPGAAPGPMPPPGGPPMMRKSGGRIGALEKAHDGKKHPRPGPQEKAHDHKRHPGVKKGMKKGGMC